MAKAYRPQTPFNVPLILMLPEYVTAKGSTKTTYKPVGIILCSFKTFGGTEVTTDAGLAVEDTAVIETWYRPDISANCRLQNPENEKDSYEILGTPENIYMRNQFLKFKIRKIRGGA